MTKHLWALDLDKNDWPWRCHPIVSVDGPRYTTACGRVYRENDRGCWSIDTPESPLPKLACPDCAQRDGGGPDA